MILHITNDFSGSTVYKNLVTELDRIGVSQIVYNPIRNEGRIGKNKISFINSDSIVLYRKVINNTTDRIFYKRKIKKICDDILKVVDLSKIKFIHAHTWYSDGGVAYELNKKFGIPYLVAVRNTDINLFLKYHIFNRDYGRRILLNAQNIVTISKVYRDRLTVDPRLFKVKSKLIKDLIVIPNGVDNFWRINYETKKYETLTRPTIQLLFVGKFTKGKRVAKLIEAVSYLNNKLKTRRYYLTLIGGGGREEHKVLALVESNPYVQYVGRINQLEKLKEYYNKADIFTMPSRAETFGLVYIEALSQGLPVLYTENEGIDGYYDNVGEKVNNSSVGEIAEKIEFLVDKYDTYNFDIEKILENHDWKMIAIEYLKLYNKKTDN